MGELVDPTDPDLISKCADMMTIVVESRKRFKKMCVKYEQNATKLENNILNLKVEASSNCKFKRKYSIPVFKKEDIDDLDKFSSELSKRAERVEDLKKKMKNAQEVVTQLKADSLGRHLREPLTVESLLAKAAGEVVLPAALIKIIVVDTSTGSIQTIC